MAMQPDVPKTKTTKGPKKSKAKGRKVGRAKRKPSHARQEARTAANKRRNKEHQAMLKARRSRYKERLAAKKLAALAWTALAGPYVPKASPEGEAILSHV